MSFFLTGRLCWRADFMSVVRDARVEFGDGGWKEDTIAR